MRGGYGVGASFGGELGELDLACAEELLEEGLVERVVSGSKGGGAQHGGAIRQLIGHGGEALRGRARGEQGGDKKER